MPNEPNVVISIECVSRDLDLLGILKVSTPSGVSRYGIGSVGIPWPIEVTSKDTAPIFVPPDDSEHIVALLMRGQQPYSNIIPTIGRVRLKAMYFDGGIFE